jgi:hypothetical protein
VSSSFLRRSMTTEILASEIAVGHDQTKTEKIKFDSLESKPRYKENLMALIIKLFALVFYDLLLLNINPLV